MPIDFPYFIARAASQLPFKNWLSSPAAPVKAPPKTIAIQFGVGVRVPVRFALRWLRFGGFIAGTIALLTLTVSCSAPVSEPAPSAAEPSATAQPAGRATAASPVGTEPQEAEHPSTGNQETENQKTETKETEPKSEASLPAAFVETLKSALTLETGISTAQMSFKSAEAVEWTNGCLDAARPGELCTQAITPGYRVVLTTPIGDYEFHTDRSGRHFRLVQAAP